MILRLIFLIIGTLIIYSSFGVLRHESLFYYGIEIPLKGNKLFVAMLMFISGIMFIWMGLKGNIIKKEKYLKCIECGEFVVHQSGSETAKKCPHCGGILENLEKFYNTQSVKKNNEKKPH